MTPCGLPAVEIYLYKYIDDSNALVEGKVMGQVLPTVLTLTCLSSIGPPHLTMCLQGCLPHFM